MARRKKRSTRKGQVRKTRPAGRLAYLGKARRRGRVAKEAITKKLTAANKRARMLREKYEAPMGAVRQELPVAGGVVAAAALDSGYMGLPGRIGSFESSKFGGVALIAAGFATKKADLAKIGVGMLYPHIYAATRQALQGM